MKKPKQKPETVLLRLRDLGCRHAVLWAFLKDAAAFQVQHNKDMEQKFKAAEDFGPALRQQQYANGIQWVLNMIQSFESLNPADSTTMMIRTVDPNAKMKWCKKSVNLKRAADAFLKALRQ